MYKKVKNNFDAFSKSILLLLIFFGVFVANTFAGGGGIEEKQNGMPMTGQANTAVSNALVNNTVSIIDYTNYFEPSTQQNKSIKNIISFGLMEESNKFITQDFTAIVELKIEYGHSAGALNTLSPNQTFTIDYKKADAAKFNSLQYFTLDDAEYVRVTLISINAPIIGTLNTKDILFVKNEMRITRFVELPATVPAPGILNAITPTLLPGEINDVVNINWTWPPNTGNNATQLEWAWIETEMESEYYVGGIVNSDLVFKNSTRIDLPYGILNYDVPLLYDGVGKLYYRIRAVNLKENGNRSDGPWNVGAAYPFNGHNNNLNWQSTTSFAEEGKRKTVIQYFDGSLRGRQTVTKDNSTNIVIKAESFYDAQGRPAIQILPTPILPTPGIINIIAYQANLNLFNGQTLNQDPAEIFDMQPVASASSLTPPLLTTSGTSQYYSVSNTTSNTGANRNIPDAEGYPYTVTRYTPDATGRVMTQSGVGLAHKMSGGHETKYYYGGAAQEELDGLFGTEAGYFSHYSKNMVKDANGQMSVSYVDMHGRTVATALAGSEAPQNLQALNFNNPQSYPNQGGTAITRNLLDNATNNVKGSSIESINSLLVPSSTLYNFEYKLNPESLQLPACAGETPTTLCYDCLYDLEIAITDESGEIAPIVRKISNVSLNPDDNCSTSIPSYVDLTPTLPTTITGNIITFNTSLGIGSYSIRKTLTISEASLQKYKTLYMSKALCKSEQQLIDSIKTVLFNSSNCGNPTPITCQNCISNLGTETTYRINYLNSLGNPSPTAEIENEIQAAYAAALQNCNALCTNVSQSVATIREMMLSDMIPYSGQYALENADSVLSPTGIHTMYDKFNIFSNNGLPHQPFYKYPWKLAGTFRDYYFDDANNIDITIHPPVPPSSFYTLYDVLDTASKTTFELLFKPSWANSLIAHHPEYQRLLFAETPAIKQCYDWINAFTQTESFTTAQNNGYLTPVANDPFFAQQPTYLDLINNSIASYEGRGIGMWQLAYGDVRCKNIIDVNQRNSCYTQSPNSNNPPPYAGFTAAENEQAWQVFKGLYAARRNSLIDSFIAISRPLDINDEENLISQRYRLWFPRTATQTAAQNQWTGWPTSQGGAPTGAGAGGGTPTTATDKCSSYINMWKNQLLQCQALATSFNKEVILTEITTRMQAVCANGTNASNTYGSSNVAPSTPSSVTDRNFEDVIKNVFLQYNIITANGVYTDNYCNPFVIEWPKPYGLGPKMVAGEMAGNIDSCNCNAFTLVKAAAASQGYNPAVLTSLNQYLQSQYGETLTQGLFDGLQHCNELFTTQCVTRDTIINYTCGTTPPVCQGGASKTIEARPPPCEDCPPPDPLPLTCENLNNALNQCGIQQARKKDSSSVSSTTSSSALSQCQITFVNCFNAYFTSSYTYYDIENIYLQNCGITIAPCPVSETPPMTCENLNIALYQCTNAPQSKQQSSSATTTSRPGFCQIAFVNCFNTFFGTNYTYEQIAGIYLQNCGITINPCPSCSITCTTTNCTNTYSPYILLQPQPLPEFLKCGYTSNRHCVSCAQLSAYTAEYKTKFDPAPNTAPIFSGTNLTPEQVQNNMNYARFINYRTGFQYDWIKYSQAAAASTPPCNVEAYSSNTSAQQNVVCGDPRPLADTITVVTESLCDKVYTMAVTMAQQIINIRTQYLLQQFDDAYKAKCLAAKSNESFTVNYTTSEYHYTLYYYDMAGSLVKTVPPKGVNPDFSVAFTSSTKDARNAGTYINTPITRPHTFATNYRYNSLGQVTAQNTPDANTSRFWYDALGRLVVSQNAQQLNTNKYSYTLYDPLGRITEVGQKPQAANSMDQTISQNITNLLSWINTTGGTKEQMTVTNYDFEYPPLAPGPTYITQQNLRNRVSFTYTKNLDTDPAPAAATFYSYDIHGNVDKLVQDYNEVAQALPAGSRYKTLSYNYDLISGKVNNVNYQDGYADAFYHRYSYDAENRLKEAETSRDKIVWERDAAYAYYKHGPLARTELGAQTVQGVDYAYTLQGWLKGINQTSLDAAGDIGQDGYGAPTPTVAKDALSFALHYYDEIDGANTYTDYKAIGTANTFAKPGAASNLLSLYNGNIAAMTVNNAGLLKANPSITNSMALLYRYKYDQLNRIVSMQAYKGLNAATNQWNVVAINDYKENTSYDPNGNILSYNRNGAPGANMPEKMDEMTYNYIAGKNQLLHVADNTGFTGNYTEAANGTVDIDNQANPNNYTYDAIGNLIGDASENINTITWSVYGKIQSINKNTGTISYKYDASGNRISKTVGNKTTVYVRDASGNVMSVYESVNSAAAIQKEVHLYGSSRLGMLTELTVPPVNISIAATFGVGTLRTFTRAEKIFELSNHLGNVLETVSDKKIAVDGNTDGVIDYYSADIISANDYYPGGMQMPGRKYGAMGRHGFNGKEQDKEIKGEGNSYDFGARIYDSRIVRWSSVDPLTRKYADISPFVAFANNPIMIIDPDGEDIVYFNSLGVEYKRTVSKTQFETYVDVKKQVQVIHFIPEFDAQGKIKPFVETRTITSPVKVPMPDIITEKLETKKGKDGQWVVEKGLEDKKYQQYDYQIAASTFLFNQSKNNGTQQFVTDGGVKIPTSITSKVSDVSPTDVKELMMQETHCGTYLPNNGTIDIMQVNNGLNNFQDYKPYKANYGLSSGVVPGPLLSLTAGLKDLMTKGFKGGVTYDKNTGKQTFTFQGWLQAGKEYNGNGVPNYKESLQRMEATKRTPTANDY